MKYTRTNPACGCTRQPVCPTPKPAACPAAVTECAVLPVMVMIRPQVWDCTYTCGQALAKGTLFPALDKPFMGKGGCCNG